MDSGQAVDADFNRSERSADVDLKLLRQSLLTMCFYCVYTPPNLIKHFDKTFPNGADLAYYLIAIGYFDAVNDGYRLSEMGYNFMVTKQHDRRAA
jgi:hypothetical protein